MRTPARRTGNLRGALAIVAATISLCLESNASTPGAMENQQDAASSFRFVENKGQWDTPARFVGRAGNTVVRVEESALLLQVHDPARRSRGVLVKLGFDGAAEDARPEGSDELPGRFHYYVGSDPADWVTNARSFSGTVHENLYDGIDLVVYERNGRLKYDLVVAPGADAGAVRIRCEGVTAVEEAAGGALRLVTELGDVVQPSPLVWQEHPNGERELLETRYRRIGDDSFGFEVVGRRSSLPLVIDPELVWSTHLGSTLALNGQGDIAYAVDMEPNGNVVVVGQTAHPDFPTTPGAFQQPASEGVDVFVTRMHAVDGSLIYSSILASSLEVIIDRATAVAVDATGRATVVGWGGPGFPITAGAFCTTSRDGFVTRFSPLGDSLEYSTFFGDSSASRINAVALTPEGSAIIGGTTSGQGGLPVTQGAYDETPNGGKDCFLTKLDPTGSSLMWSTHLGHTGRDELYALAVDSSGSVTATGRTQSANFPTTPGAYDRTYNGFPSASSPETFVTRLRSDGSDLEWSTFLGHDRLDLGHGIAAHPDGGVVVVGETFSTLFPVTSGVFQETPNFANNFTEGFVTRLNSTGSAIVWSSFLGGLWNERVYAVEVDGLERVVVAGSTSGNDFPVTPNAFDTTYNGASDIFLTRITPDGSALDYSTYIGGLGQEDGFGMALRGTDRAVVAGVVWGGGGYPTTPGAYQPDFQGGQADAVVSVIGFQDAASTNSSSAPKTGPIVLSATIEPSKRGWRFIVLCEGAPANSSGWVSVDGRPQSGALPDPTVRIPILTDGNGSARLSLPFSSDLSGLPLALQCSVLDASGNARSLVRSNVVRLEVP